MTKQSFIIFIFSIRKYLHVMEVNYFGKFFGLILGCNEKSGWGIDLLSYYLTIWSSL